MPMRKLDAPPIIEVMCGVFFPPIGGLDPIVAGGWWHSVKETYPKHSIQPAVTEASGIFVSQGTAPLRSWLISGDDEWVIQVQPDRFYVNWRKRSGVYPRFNDHDGLEGVLTRALRELDRFRTYCKSELQSDIVPSTVELAKVDLIIEGPHWKDETDLGTLLPVIADVGRFANSPALELGMHAVVRRTDGVMRIDLSLSTETIVEGQLARAVKIDTRTSRAVTGGVEVVREAFVALNDDANAVFEGLINPGQMSRFDDKRAPK
jgi:uncharacterized protein (TIGR04255 family)